STAQVEPAGAVVQQRRVGGPQRRGDSGVGLVAAGADAVVAESALAQLPSREVQVPAGRLGVEQGEQFGVQARAGAGARLLGGDGCQEVVVERCALVGHHYPWTFCAGTRLIRPVLPVVNARPRPTSAQDSARSSSATGSSGLVFCGRWSTLIRRHGCQWAIRSAPAPLSGRASAGSTALPRPRETRSRVTP